MQDKEIEYQQTTVIRVRADVLYRLVFDPSLRASWDPNIAKADYVAGHSDLKQNSEVKIKFRRSFLWATAIIRYGHLQPSARGGFEIVGGLGPLRKFRQTWQFKNMAAGTEVTMRIKTTISYKWLKQPIERLVINMIATTLLGLQKRVDSQAYEKITKEVESRKKAAKAAKKNSRKKKPS